MLSKAIIYLFFYLIGFCKFSYGFSNAAEPLPIDNANDIDDIPLETKDLPKELQDSLSRDEIIDEIIIKEDDKEQKIRVNEEKFKRKVVVPSFSDEKSKYLNQVLSNLLQQSLETERSADMGESLENDLSREEIRDLLRRIQDIDNAVPINRDSPSNLKKRMAEFVRKIIVDQTKLPGEDQADGSKCLKKVDFVNETKFDRGMKCQHVLKTKCHLTYITDYHPTADKKCETAFTKDCYISFKPVPHVEKIRKCYTPYTHKCNNNITGDDVCRDRYEDNCETTYSHYSVIEQMPECKMDTIKQCTNKSIDLIQMPLNEKNESYAVKTLCEEWPIQNCTIESKNVTKVHPRTQCTKIKRRICQPSNCDIVKEPEVCHEEQKTLVQKIPEEECNLVPQKHCRTESTLVPKLIPKQNCVKVPKDICVNTKSNPREETVAVVKNWCYNPTELIAKINTL